MELLEWGQVTPEITLNGKGEYIYVYNHDLSTIDKIDRTIRFLLGRLNYYDNHLPPNPTHCIHIDIRGQSISEEDCIFIINKLQKTYSRTDCLKVSFIK